MSCRPFKQRLIGRRREIYKAIQAGTYWEWIERDRCREAKLHRFRLFRANFSAIRGNTLPSEDCQEYLDASYTAEPEDIQSAVHWRGEARMWASVLARAVLDYKMFGDITREESPTKATLGAQARGWLYDCSEEIGSFRWICSILDLGEPEEALQHMEKTEYEPRQCASKRKKSEQPSPNSCDEQPPTK